MSDFSPALVSNLVIGFRVGYENSKDSGWWMDARLGRERRKGANRDSVGKSRASCC